MLLEFLNLTYSIDVLPFFIKTLCHCNMQQSQDNIEDHLQNLLKRRRFFSKELALLRCDRPYPLLLS